MKRASTLLAIVLATAIAASAQMSLTPSVVASGGGYAEAGGMSISWTIGELAVTTLTGGNIMLTQGFQQPFDIDVGIDPERVSWGISVYPNPVGDELRIRFDTKQTEDFILEIQDVTGRIISQEVQKEVDPGDVRILNTSAYKNGVYFLKVLTPDRQQVQVTSLRKL